MALLQRDVAAHLDMSTRNLRDLIREGHVPTLTAPGVTLDDIRVAYIRHLRKAKAGQNVDASLSAERSRLASAQADHQEMVNQLKRGELLPAAEVRAAGEAMIAASRARLLALPSRVAPEVVGVDGLAQVVGILDDAVREALEELSGIVIEPTDDGADRDADSGGMDRDSAHLAPAAATDRQRVGGRRAAAKPGGKRRARKVGNKPG